MDIDILLALQDFRTSLGPALNGVLEVLRMFGEATVLMALASVVMWGIDKRVGHLILLNSSFALLINQAIKITACVYRPWIRDSRLLPVGDAISTATGYSFPSAHTALSIAMWGGMGVGLKSKSRWFFYVGVFISAIVAISRCYVGVHTPQDVIVSAVIGVAVLWISSRVFDYIDANPSKDVYLAVTGILAAVVLAIYAATKSYPMDYVDGKLLVDPADMINDAYMTVGVAVGFFLGWIIDRRFIKSSTEGSFPVRTVRVVVGFIVLLLLKKYLEIAFVALGDELSQVISAAVLVLYVTAIYPLIFMKVEALILRKRV